MIFVIRSLNSQAKPTKFNAAFRHLSHRHLYPVAFYKANFMMKIYQSK